MVTRKKWTSILATALVGSLAGIAGAAEPGFYVTATVGTGDEDPKSAGTNFGNLQGIFHVDPDHVNVDDGNFAWGIGLGYRINDYLAGEVEYVDFGTTDIQEHYTIPNPGPFPFPSELDLNYSSKVTGPVLSVLGTLPLGQNFELFLRGGALFSSRERRTGGQIVFAPQEQKFASTVWLAGAGASWSFAKHWGIRAEYQQTGSLGKTIATGDTKLKRLSLSALYRF
jgi:opacity protein-like surface antigen